MSPADAPSSTESGEEAPPTVRVSELGGEHNTLKFVEGQTVGQYLTEAEIELGDERTATLNGEPADPDTVVEANSVLVVAPNVSNG